MTPSDQLLEFLSEPMRDMHLNREMNAERQGVFSRIMAAVRRFFGFEQSHVTPKSHNNSGPGKPDPVNGITHAAARGGKPWLQFEDDDVNVAWKKHFQGITPKEFANIMRRDMPRGLRMTMSVDYTGEIELECIIKNRDPNAYEKYLNAKRTIDTKHMTIKHDYFYMLDTAQGKGVGRIFLANSMEIYKRLGIQKIKVLATDDAGAYAWARFGFVPNQSEWNDLRDELHGKIKGISAKLTADQKALLKTVLASENPKSIWLISDLREQIDGKPLGRLLLAGETWHGSFDMTDPAAMARFDSYVKSNPKIAARVDGELAKPPVKSMPGPTPFKSA